MAQVFRSAVLLVSILTASDALARVFVLPHVLEKSGLVSDTNFTFDTTIFVEYTGGTAGCPPSSPCAFLELYLFDERTGLPLANGMGEPYCPVVSPCFFTIGSGDEGTEPSPRKRTIVLDEEITNRGGFPDSAVKLGFAVVVVNGDFENVSVQGFVVNSHTSALDLSVFGFEPVPIAPVAGIGSPPLFPRGASFPSLGASRVLTDIREDQGTVATTNGAYDTSLSIFYLDAWFGPAPPTAVDIDFFDAGGSPMLDAQGMPYSITIADLSQLPQPVIVDLETPLFGGVAPGAPGKRGYATVELTGALPERVDVTSFVRKAVTGPSDLDDDGFYEQALPAPEAGGARVAAAAVLAIGCGRRHRAAGRRAS
jgi:hypothetical protein